MRLPCPCFAAPGRESGDDQSSDTDGEAPLHPGVEGRVVWLVVQRPTVSAAWVACAVVKPSYSSCSIKPEREKDEYSR